MYTLKLRLSEGEVDIHIPEKHIRTAQVLAMHARELIGVLSWRVTDKDGRLVDEWNGEKFGTFESTITFTNGVVQHISGSFGAQANFIGALEALGVIADKKTYKDGVLETE